MRPDVRPVLGEAFEEGDQLHQLVVVGVHEPALDRDPVLQLISEGLRGVVDDDRLGEIATYYWGKNIKNKNSLVNI